MAHGESSKKGKKKGKMEQAAIQAALAEEDRANQGVLIREPIDERATVSTQCSRNEEKGKGKQKTGRGLAKLKLNETNKTFEVNEFCELVGPNSSEYCGDLGTLVREHVPSSIKSWKHVPQKIKEDMWDILKRKWKLSEVDKKIALQRMRKIRRDSKSKVFKKIRDFEASDNESGGEHDINDLRPAWMDDEDWAKFLEQCQSDEFKDESLKFQEIRKKQTFVHRLSRKGFVRLGLAYDLKKNTDDPSKITRVDVWTKGYTKDGKSDNPEIQRVIEQMDSFSNTPKGQSQSSINNDALVHVFGAERPGRIRSLGFGATPS